jgi:hypothetical protein
MGWGFFACLLEFVLNDLRIKGGTNEIKEFAFANKLQTKVSSSRKKRNLPQITGPPEILVLDKSWF